MSKTVLLESNDGYEALYIDKKLVKSGNPLNEGTSRIKYFNQLAKKYGFSLDEMEEFYLDDSDDEDVCSSGCFYENLNEYKGTYQNATE